MLTLFYGPGACSMASHIVLEESGEKYEPKKMDLAKGEQRSESYLKMNPQGRVPCLQLDNGEYLSENTAILPYLGKRFGAWPKDGTAEAKAMSLIGFFAASVHPAHAHVGRPVLLTREARVPVEAQDVGDVGAAVGVAAHRHGLGRAPAGDHVGDRVLPFLRFDGVDVRSLIFHHVSLG